MRAWHIVSSEYPPDVGGVSDYTRQVALALAKRGCEVHVWCPPSNTPRVDEGVSLHEELGRFRPSDLSRMADSLDAFPAPRRLLVQWVPHGYGYRSMNLWFCLWLAVRSAKGDVLELMVHEPFIEPNWRRVHHLVMAFVHRLMTAVLMRAASKVWVSIPAWESRLRPYAMGRPLDIEWLPIPSCVSESRANDAIRSTVADGAQPIVGHFGSYGREVSDLLAERLPAIMTSRSRPTLLLIGARSEAYRTALIAQHPHWSSRIHATGYVPPSDLAGYLRACDLFVQPYPDGITSRRTSAMACLALGLPLVTTSGHLTESLWAESGAVSLASLPDAESCSAAAVRLLDRPESRRQLAACGQRLYREHFSLDRIVDAFTAEERPEVALPSCA